MSINVKMVFVTMVKPFYRQYTALFAFLIFIFFFAVGRANEVGMLEYHFALMKGILMNRSFLILVLIAWLVYALKCQQFTTRLIMSREYYFLFQLARLNASRIFSLMLVVHVILFLPVLWYALILVWVGMNHQLERPAMIIISYLFLICVTGAARSAYLLRHPGIPDFSSWVRMPWPGRTVPYWKFLTRFIMAERKWLFAGIKLYSAGTLYFLLYKADLTQRSDLQLIYLFYSFGVLGHGVLIHQLRTMEDECLGFYRSLPISLINRWLQYAWLYFLVFLPEILIILRQTGSFPQFGDSFSMAFFGYSMLLLLNSVLFIQHFKMTEYLKIITGIFFLVYISVLTGVSVLFSIILCWAAGFVFFSRYCRYDPGESL